MTQSFDYEEFVRNRDRLPSYDAKCFPQNECAPPLCVCLAKATSHVRGRHTFTLLLSQRVMSGDALGLSKSVLSPTILYEDVEAPTSPPAPPSSIPSPAPAPSRGTPPPGAHQANDRASLTSMPQSSSKKRSLPRQHHPSLPAPRASSSLTVRAPPRCCRRCPSALFSLIRSPRPQATCVSSIELQLINP